MKRAFLILACATFFLAPTSRADAACGDLGGVVIAGVCTIQPGTHNVASGQTIAVAESVLVQTGAIIDVSTAATPLVVNVSGDFTMEAGSLIDGSISGGGHGADIEINATGAIRLIGGAQGARILSNQGGSCNAASTRGGNISLVAQGNVTTDDGSVINTISGCGRGEIFIKGLNLDLQGIALSRGNTTKGRGGPVSAIASCNLTLGPTGQLVSQGMDPGADLVHVEGGCIVKIFGFVASIGAGHIGGANRCQPSAGPPPTHTDKPANSQACIEIWAGNELLIDSNPPNAGHLNADTGFSGGSSGTSWIDVFARGPVTINGDVAVPFAVHANQGVGTGKGGTVTVKSVESSVSLAGLALQASDTASGGDGGVVTIESNTNLNFFILLKGGEVEARGSTNSTGHGGTVNAKSFNGNIGAVAGSLIDVVGHNAPDGVVNLSSCVPPIPFPNPPGPGAVTPAGVTINTTNACSPGSGPTVPSYVTLPDCVCLVAGCPCVTDFSFVMVGANKTVKINGTQLTAVTQVQLSTGTCNPGDPGTQVVTILPGQTDATMSVNVNNPPVLPGMYKILTISGGGSCCSSTLVNIP